MSEKADTNNPEHCSCCTCGYTWVKGQHGGHSCAQVMEVTVADLRARLANYEDAEGNPISTIAEQAREIERLTSQLEHWLSLDKQRDAALSALKAQPSGVVLPEPMKRGDEGGSGEYGAAMIRGYNACLREVARLNACQVSATVKDCLTVGGVDERAAFEAAFENTFYSACFERHESDEYVGRGLQGAWLGWQARAALSAPSHGEQVREWSLAADELPANGKPVLAYYLNSHGKGRRIRAEYVKAWSVQADDLSDPDTECVEYSEQEDAYYIRQGWYELIDNWDEYGRIAVHEGVITHWMPLPAAPSAVSQEQGE